MSWQRGSTSVRQNQTHLLLWQIWVPARETQGDFSHHFSALCQYPAVKYSRYSRCENSCLESCTISVGTRVWCRHTNVRTVRKKKPASRCGGGGLNDDWTMTKECFFPSDRSGCRSQDAACFPVWKEGLQRSECHRKLQVMHEHSPYRSQRGRLRDSCRAPLGKQWITILKHSAPFVRKQESSGGANSRAACATG